MPDAPLLANFYGGYDQPAPDGATHPVINPATGETLARIPLTNARGVEEAVEAAAAKAAWWSARTPQQRSLVLLSLASAVEQRSAEFVYALARDTGLPLAVAREFEVPAAVRNLRYWATRILHESGEARAEPGGPLTYTLSRPVGVTALLLPATRGLSWLTQLAGAALGAGNTVVAKPSAKAPLAGRLFADLLNEAGVPPGVLNIVFGNAEVTGRALVELGGVAAVAYVGSEKNACELGAGVLARGKKFFSETGGRQATIVLADADTAEASIAAVRGALSSDNETSLDTSLFFIERTIYSAFAEKFARTASLLRVGDPEERETQVGPVPTAERRAGLLRFVAESGGTILLGGKNPALPEPFGAGFFVSPTLLGFEGVPVQVPPPGVPLACLVPFDGAPELLRLVNGTPAFTAASLWTKDIVRAHTLARSLKVGTVVVNSWSLSDPGHPLAGAKRSGRAEAHLLAAFSETQTIRIKL